MSSQEGISPVIVGGDAASDRPPPLPAALADRVGFLVAKVHADAHAKVNETLAPTGLHVKEYAALSVLNEAGPLSQQALGEILRIDRTTMVAVIDGLEKNGFVDRERNIDDRRAYALALTSEGGSVLRKARRLVLGAERKFLAPLSAEEVSQLRDLLTRLLPSR